MFGLILLLVFVPTFLYVGLLWWLDRYEKEPVSLLAAAFLWGSVPAIIMAVILEVVLDIPITAFSPSPLMYELLGASVVAPVVEEMVKGFALLTLLLFWHREIDSPLDGLIYGGMVGFGFAAVEDVFYLLAAFDAGGVESTVSLAFFRLIVFGLNHAMYTGFTGLGVALALETRQRWLKFVLPALGFSLAVATHAVHNALSTVFAYGEGFLGLCFAVVADWSGVLVLLAVAVWALYLEKRRLVQYLTAAVESGVVDETLVPDLSSPWRRWTSRFLTLLSGDLRRWRVLKRYSHVVTEAAFDWHRWGRGDAKSKARLAAREQELFQLGEDLG
jgi:protease PrsW